MGLSSIPTPTDSVLTLLLVNTAISFSLFKGIFQSILHRFGFDQHYLHETDIDDPSHLSSQIVAGPISCQIKNQVKVIPFGDGPRDRLDHLHDLDCRVCLSRFEPESMVNWLPCGHFFHAVCLAKWLDYQHVTCPLCRTRVFPDCLHDDGDGSWSLF